MELELELEWRYRAFITLEKGLARVGSARLYQASVSPVA